MDPRTGAIFFAICSSRELDPCVNSIMAAVTSVASGRMICCRYRSTVALSAPPDYSIQAKDLTEAFPGGQWESITITAHSEGGSEQRWSLKSYHGAYLSAQANGALKWDALTEGPNELFTPLFDAARSSFKLLTRHGRLLSVSNRAGGDKVSTRAEGPSMDCVFVLAANPWYVAEKERIAAEEASALTFTALRADERVFEAEAPAI